MLYRTVVALSLCLACETHALNVCSAPTRVSFSRVAAARIATLCMEEGEAAAPVEAAEVVDEAAAAPKPTGGAKTPIGDLEIGTMVEGTIKSVMTYGAFVDIGASTDGLLHVSEITNEFVKDANEKLKAGETVQVRIKSVNVEKNQVALSAKEESAPRAPRGKRADLSEYASADDKVFITGKVNSITDYGAFVTIKEGVDGLCHISQIQEGGVGKVSDVLAVGDEVEVRIVSFDAAKRRISLSRLPWSEKGEGGEKKPKRGGRGGGGVFGDDAAFKLKEDELDALTVVDGDFGGSFEEAFKRAAEVTEAKKNKMRFTKQVL